MATMKDSTRGITRRRFATAALAVPLGAQAPEAKPADELEAARTQTKQTIAQLRKIRVATLLEPSFIFRP